MLKVQTLRWLVVANLVTLAGTAQAAPPSRHADRARVELALSTYHRPPTARQLLMLGESIDAVLRQIVDEPRGNRLARNRALTILRHFPGVETEALLARILDETRAASKGMAVLDLSQALPSYAAVVGARGLAQIQPLFAHPVLEVRIAAGVALRLSRHPDARALISSRIASEPSPAARAQLQRELSILDQLAKGR